MPLPYRAVDAMPTGASPYLGLFGDSRLSPSELTQARRSFLRFFGYDPLVFRRGLPSQEQAVSGSGKKVLNLNVTADVFPELNAKRMRGEGLWMSVRDLEGVGRHWGFTGTESCQK